MGCRAASARSVAQVKTEEVLQGRRDVRGGGGRTRGTSQLLGSVNALHFSLRALFFGGSELRRFDGGSIGSSFVGESMLVIACVFATDADIICSCCRSARQRVLIGGVGGGAGT